MADVTLTNLITKVRRLTARPSSNQITDASVTDYINQYYEFDFPQELKLFDFKTTYEFITEPNVDQYTLSQDNRNNFKSFEPPVYISGNEASYYQNYEIFFRLYPRINTEMTLATATTAIGAGPYSGTLSAIPVLRNSLLISAVNAAGTTLTARDNGSGTLTGNVTGGTVNYTTGAVAALTFTSAIPNGNVITAKWNQYASARPTAMLFYDNVFTMRPVPDDAYTVQINAFAKPTAYVSTTGTTRPFLDDYFQLLAYGAALKIFIDSMEMEAHAMLKPLYDEQLRLAGRKTLMQIKTQRVQTIYNDDSTVARTQQTYP